MVLGALFSAVFLALMITTGLDRPAADLLGAALAGIQLCLCYGFCSTALAFPRAPDRECHSASGQNLLPDEFRRSVASTAMGVLIAAIVGSYMMAFCLLPASALTSAVVVMSWRPAGQSAFVVQPAGA
jgi:hypothetical protein